MRLKIFTASSSSSIHQMEAEIENWQKDNPSFEIKKVQIKATSSDSSSQWVVAVNYTIPPMHVNPPTPNP